MMDEGMDRVVPMRQLDDFKVAEGDPDVRGWEVMSADGRRIGQVEELMVDTEAMKVRYLDVEVEQGMVAEGGHVLVPIGYARLERDDRRVMVDNLQSSQLSTMPVYDRSPVTRDFEDRVETGFRAGGTTTGTTAAGLAGSAGMAHEARPSHERVAEGDAHLTLNEERLNVGTREVEAGRVEIGKRVETEHVTENVQTRREEVTLERRPITDPMAAREGARIEGDEIRIPLHEEEVVVEKRVVPTEELVVRKHQVVENTPVEADLRREHLEVRDEGGLARGDRLDDRLDDGTTRR
ncbi:MAG TPA: DUF2382 domain-containing protein [Longimicrobium sp.]|nr:DUF2382 domain-containing protein [Longimicrobium sp.]